MTYKILTLFIFITMTINILLVTNLMSYNQNSVSKRCSPMHLRGAYRECVLKRGVGICKEG